MFRYSLLYLPLLLAAMSVHRLPNSHVSMQAVTQDLEKAVEDSPTMVRGGKG